MKPKAFLLTYTYMDRNTNIQQFVTITFSESSGFISERDLRSWWNKTKAHRQTPITKIVEAKFNPQTGKYEKVAGA